MTDTQPHLLKSRLLIAVPIALLLVGCSSPRETTKKRTDDRVEALAKACAEHGGVADIDRATYVTCKDGSVTYVD